MAFAVANDDKALEALPAHFAVCVLFDDAEIALARQPFDLFLHRALIVAVHDALVSLDALIGLDAIAAIALLQLLPIELRGHRVLALILKTGRWQEPQKRAQTAGQSPLQRR